MSITNRFDRLQNRRKMELAAAGPLLVLLGAIGAALAFAVLMQPQLAHEALVPATVMLIFTLAAGSAALGWLRPLPKHQFTYWDAAGVLTFIGICAAATVEPEQMVQLVAGTERPR
jgi:membrane associated rhomboid family serine protease